MEKSNLVGLNILLGVSGGVAAYKAVDLASKLAATGAKVHTIMTENACKLVTAKSFEAVTGLAVYTSMWNTPQQFEISHVTLADKADIVVVAPATANTIGKSANGICDDLLSTTLCACWQKPVLIAPAMNSNMWNNPAVQQNVEKIKQMGAKLIGPECGRLACGTEGVGRMAEPEDILEQIEKIVSQVKKN
jgi:phosphopantothenoylcysteine decarboxylase/phosphopantothenate--cysteine ligase